MKNWKTTLSGILGSIAISLIPVVQGKGLDLQYIIIGSLMGILGYFAKDYDTTGVGRNAEKENETF
jgi:hypothetical protein